MKAVLFDLDGVIIDSEVWFYELNRAYLVKRCGSVSDEDLKSTIGLSTDLMYVLFNKLIGSESLDETIDDYLKYYRENELDFSKILKKGALATFEQLKKEEKLIAVCSSSPMSYILHALKANSLLEYVDLVLSGDDFHESKPNPEIYLTAARKLNLSVEDCLVVEDSTIGIEAGKRAGMKVAAMKEPFGLDQSQADYHIAELSDVVEYIA